MTLRCGGRPARALDLELARLGATLVRLDGAVFAQAPDAAALRAALAFAGVPTEPALLPDRPPSHLPCVGRTLDPLAGDGIVDAVRVRTVATGAATRWLRRYPWHRLGRAAAVRCRAVLHDEDAVVEWERRVWIAPALARRSDVRRAVRPVLLDRGALVAARPGPWCLAGAGLVTAWAFAA